MPNFDVSMFVAFILYLAFVMGIAFWSMYKSRGGGAGEYFLAGRKMGKWVTALSAQTSDMSGWLLMGFPGSILAFGLGRTWIAIGLILGTYLNWLLVAARLRRFTKAADDAITIPEYLTKRFQSKSYLLQIVCAGVFLIFFTIYVAAGILAGGTVLNSIVGIGEMPSFILFTFFVLAYTFLGGLSAVCRTDFFQGMLMLVAIVAAPIVVYFTSSLDFSGMTIAEPNYWNLLPSGRLDYESVSSILGDLAWGLGYFGMPHIIIKFMAIKKSSDLKFSRRIAMTWVIIALCAAVLVGLVGRAFMPELVDGNRERVFIEMVIAVFPGFIAGILLSAIVAAAMSTADSQLLVASASITNDIYKPLVKKKVSDKKIVWIGRILVAALAVVAFFIAVNPNGGNIMGLVANAWAGFGSAFGPVIILSLYWKRFTYRGAVAGILSGAGTVALWVAFLSEITGIYELLPGFIIGLIACVVVSLLDKAPSKDVERIYENALDPAFED
jgi:sodium/proline symporter